ncbi:MAG: class I SAM-dependent methyltransferase [Treponema sp.]|jgi:ubiquinone/menaquinone biosynthesis C-methylase UbiE|nr:class I SAM-dependent methyltransferase [Treponema sp.]
MEFIIFINKKLPPPPPPEDKYKVIHRSRLELLDKGNNITKNIGDAWITEDSIDKYYDPAEKWLDVFWNVNSVFYRCFDQLNIENIVELACGHGRHVQKYLEKAQKITLVDINQQNIDFCKKRYSDEIKINYLVNNGSNFDEIKSDSQTAIFTYDAMVHFEMLDILSYIKESNRILMDGGKILFHHSNAAFSPELGWYKPHGRNFMSADIFAYLALHHGFVVLSQDVFSWGEGENYAKDIDCLSLCQKIKTIK